MDREDVSWDIKWRVEPILLPYDKLLPDDLSDRITNAVIDIVEEQVNIAWERAMKIVQTEIGKIKH